MHRVHLALYLVFTFLAICRCVEVDLEVEEEGMKFREKIFVDDKNNRFEYIEVPKHGGRAQLSQLVDTKLHYIINKVPAMKMCYVMKTDGHEDKPLDEVKSVKAVKNKFPYHHYTIESKKILLGGDVDTTTEIGKIAKKFCKGGYEMKNANIFKGGEDVTDYVNKLIQSRTAKGNKGNKRDATDAGGFVMMSCSAADRDIAVREMTRCNGMLTHWRATCRIRTETCTYRLHCDWDQSARVSRCKGTHDMNNVLCCTYKCLK